MKGSVNRTKRFVALLLTLAMLIQWGPVHTAAAEPATDAAYVCGDVNSDGKVNGVDVSQVCRYIAGTYGMQINIFAADVNADGIVDQQDVTLLRQFIAGGYDVVLKPGLGTCNVRFETGGGTAMADREVQGGTLISTFGEPYWAEHIFRGWFYDAQMTQPVESTARVTGDMTLYAGWLEQAAPEALEHQNFASALDVSGSYTISILSSDPDMTAADVLVAITAEDLTDPDATDIISVTGSSGSFTVSGGPGGFRAGGTYSLKLHSDKLTFAGKDQEVRQYNLTIHREEMDNLTVRGDIQFLPLRQVSNIVSNGQSVSSLDLALYETDGTTTTMAALTTGTFTYNGSCQLQKGDVVCIYDGLIPTERTKDTPDDQMGDMAYLKLTGVSGSTYTYKNAEAEEILFMPDVLPMPEGVDLDTQDQTITVENKYLDYSADIYAYNELDSQTVVEAGDFMAFYTGEFGKDDVTYTGYAKIVKVQDNGDDTTTITTVAVTWDQVSTGMDMHMEDELSAEELLQGVDIEKMEAQIRKQAIDSGFTEEAAQYLTELALSTENFTVLSQNTSGTAVTLDGKTPVSTKQLRQLSGNGVHVTIDETVVTAKVGKNPTHLGGVKGIAITLDVKVVFTVSTVGSDNKLQITVNGSFVQEVGVGVDVDSHTDWEGIIPKDVKITANLDLANYTNVSFKATMAEKRADGSISATLDMANEIKALLQQSADGENGEEVYEQLTQRYCQMLSIQSDWVKVVEQNISKVQKNLPLDIPLLRLEFTIDFVVYMDASVSVGFDFNYLEGTRYVFTVRLKDQEVSCKPVTLQEQTYSFSFYSMGYLAMRAGVELDFSIAVLSEHLGSMNFVAGVGAYTKLWGYFYYELQHSTGAGNSVKHSGALMIEVGAYAEAGLQAKTVGKFAAEATLMDEEWKLYEAGRRDNVQDFALIQEEMPKVVMKQFVQRVQLSDDIFNMEYLDLKVGEMRNAIYSDWNDPSMKNDFRNGENFVITMTNDKFTYDPKTNTIQVTPEEDDVKITGEMIITWKNQPMSFSSKAITRTISLQWDNLRDGYLIVPYTNGGSFVPLTLAEYEAKVKAPEDPVRRGYYFGGWYADEELTTPYTYPEIMPNEDQSIYAKWEAATDIPYTVEHYRENFRSGEYELVEVETFAGTTDTYVTPEFNTYEGYVTPAQAQLKIRADGGAVLRYYYTLERHTVTFDAGQVDGVDITAEQDKIYTLKYGAGISAPQLAVSGYRFAGWTTDGTTATTVADTMGTTDLTYYATWEKVSDTPYRIEYYVQQPDGRYTMQHMVKDETVTGATFSAEQLRSMILRDGRDAEELFAVPDAIVFENVTVKGIACDVAAVDGSGKTVIKVNYKRLQYSLTFESGYEGGKTVVKDVYYGAQLVAPQNMTRTGYVFAGWDTEPVATMPAQSLSYKAQWTPAGYTVRFHKDSDTATGTMADQAFTYDLEQVLTAGAFARPYYTFAGWATQSGGTVVYKDGQSVQNLTAQDGGTVDLYAVWTPVDYTITYNVNGGSHNNTTTYNAETATIYLMDPVKTGYEFGGWYQNAACTGTAVTEIQKGSGGDITLYAKWIPGNNTAYKVEHYHQQLDGTYVLADTELLTGTTDATVTPAVKQYRGFAAPATQSAVVKADGTLTVQYYYNRNSYTITFDANGGQVTPASVIALYGAAITLPTPEKTGYGFSGWYKAGTIYNEAVMGAENLTLVAGWTAGQYGYTVNHYQMNVDGKGYTLFATENGTAAMDEVVTAQLKQYEGFTAPGETSTITITADADKNVADYYYTRNCYQLTWDLGAGSAAGQNYTSGSVYYGAAITAPTPVRTGYEYSWSETIPATMPASDVTYTVNWIANVYKVTFNLNGGRVISGSADQRDVAYGSTYGELATLVRTGYNFQGWYDGDQRVLAHYTMQQTSDHTLIAKFVPITYTITYSGVGAQEHSNPVEYTAEQVVALTAPAMRLGYTFRGWFTNAALTGQPVEKLELGTVGNKTFYAKWTENTYAVTFHASNGTGAEEVRTLLYTALLGENTFVYNGYSFMGWSDGVQTYGVDTPVSQLVTADTTALHLDALWQQQLYTITYENNMAAATHENPTEYTVDDQIALAAPNEPAGYRFLGWYDNSSFEGAPVEVIPAGTTGHKVFYAAWQPIIYTVTLYANDGGDTVITIDPMTIDNALPSNTFQRAGYSFLGWATTPTGTKLYDDGAVMLTVAGSANAADQISLYAVWELNVYTITYNMGSYSQETTHNNPTSYSIETGEDIVLETLTPNSSEFKFGGWYTDAKFSGSPVETISFLDGTDYTLYAKWEHGGIFSVKYTSRASSGSNYKATYTVTRTVPTGAVLTDAAQYVYVRTLNGTAYASTADVSGQDKYHFIHNSAILQFATASATSMTFTVVEKDGYNSDYVASTYQIGGKTRNYYVEIYKVVSTQGLQSGVIESGKGKVTRTLSASSYELTKSFYNWNSKLMQGSSKITVTDDGYEKNTRYNINIADQYTTAQKKFAQIVSGEYGFYIQYTAKEVDSGYQRVNFVYATSYNSSMSRVAAYTYSDGYDGSSYTVTLPNNGTGNRGSLRFTQTADEAKEQKADPSNYHKVSVDESWDMTAASGSTPAYAHIPVGQNVNFGFNASGDKEDNWQYWNLYAYYKVIDTDWPRAQYVAPLALTDYKVGDEVMLTIIFNEPIARITGSTPKLALSTEMSKYFENPVYVDNGTGVNALVFKVTVKQELSTDLVQNTINKTLTFPLNTGGSFSSKVGSLSATLWDILDN